MQREELFFYKFYFSKKKDMCFISHLDLMRLFMRALRRADLPLKLTEGFNPHPKFSLARALKLGVESEREEATVVLREFIKVEDVKTNLQQQLPDGIEINDVFLIKRQIRNH